VSAPDLTLDDWRRVLASGNRSVTYVGLSGSARLRAKLVSVAASGLRIRFDGGAVERVHPSDVRVGHPDAAR
jgi:hypothetical protein